LLEGVGSHLWNGDAVSSYFWQHESLARLRRRVGSDFLTAEINRRRRCGNVEIPRLLRDFQARWKLVEKSGPGGRSGFSGGRRTFPRVSTARHFHSEPGEGGERWFSPPPVETRSRTWVMLSKIDLPTASVPVISTG